MGIRLGTYWVQLCREVILMFYRVVEELYKL